MTFVLVNSALVIMINKSEKRITQIKGNEIIMSLPFYKHNRIK